VVADEPGGGPRQPRIPRPGGAVPRRVRHPAVSRHRLRDPHPGQRARGRPAGDPPARVACADIDPVAIAHSRAILADCQNATVIDADLREPQRILAHPGIRPLVDLGQPAGLLLVAVLHFIADAEDPWRMVATLRDALAPGSYLVLCHATDESRPAAAQATEKVYNRTVTTNIHMRSQAEILRFFDGFELVDPGLVYVSQWRPDSPADVPSDPGQLWGLVGVGRRR
jgi:hypothetical protein